LAGEHQRREQSAKGFHASGERERRGGPHRTVALQAHNCQHEEHDAQGLGMGAERRLLNQQRTPRSRRHSPALNRSYEMGTPAAHGRLPRPIRRPRSRR
jgi:hypothetical protein